MVFQRVSQIEPRLEPVMILAAYALPFEIARLFEIDHDPLHGPFCDQNFHRNVSNADPGPEKNAMQNVSVIAQKRPIRVP